MNNLIWNFWKHVEYNETSSKRLQKNKKFERVLRQISMNFLTNITTKSIRNVDKSKIIFRFSVKLITSTSKNVVKSIEIELNFFIKSNEIQQSTIIDVQKKITQTLINDQKIILKNDFVIFNMRYRWWQTWTDMKKIKIWTKSEYVIENDSIRKLKALNINFLNMRNQKTIKIDSIIA